MIELPVIALATPADATPIAVLSRDEIERGFRWSWTPDRVLRSIEARDTNVIVARCGTSIVGFALMKYRSDDAHLLLMAVDPGHRRKGTATAMLAWLERTLRIAGITRIKVEMRMANRVAQAFYAKLGYKPVNTTSRYYQGVEAALHLVKELQPGDWRS